MIDELNMEQIKSESQDMAEKEVFDIDKEEIEDFIEVVHKVSTLKQNELSERLRKRLYRIKRARILKRVVWGVSGVAAVFLLYVGIDLLQFGEIKNNGTFVEFSLTNVTVPTIIAVGENEVILSVDTLDGRNESVEENDKEKQSVSVEYNRVVIPKGFTYQMRLADGSLVSLNAGSELVFPAEFSDTLRAVEFKGEGYFEIAKGKTPFRIKAGETHIQVYGTKFNVFYSKELAVTEAVLLEGSIGMNIGGMERRIVPDEKVSYTVGDSVLRVEQVNSVEYINWLGATFKYDKVRLDKIMHDIACWYGVEIFVKPELKEQIYTLEIDKSLSFKQVMKMMELIMDQKIIEKGGVYQIY